MPTLLLAAAAAAFALQAATPEIQVETLGEGTYRLTITVEGTTDPAVAQAALAPKVLALCRGAPIRFGQYRFSADGLAPGQAATDHLDKVTLVQDLACGDAATSVETPRAPAPVIGEAEIERTNPEIQTLTERFFRAADEGRDADSWTMIAAEMSGDGSLESWVAAQRDRRARTGPTLSRQVARLTWYQNPASAEPGHYVAVDYVAYGELHDTCGYLVWFRPDASAPFLLARQDTTLLPRDLDDATRKAMRERHCILL